MEPCCDLIVNAHLLGKVPDTLCPIRAAKVNNFIEHRDLTKVKWIANRNGLPPRSLAHPFSVYPLNDPIINAIVALKLRLKGPRKNKTTEHATLNILLDRPRRQLVPGIQGATGCADAQALDEPIENGHPLSPDYPKTRGKWRRLAKASNIKQDEQALGQ
mmetsp:Transcript_3100/g.6558  ORF Transcript_3100/g.6558 Transcript_3100/m.6558 type:complete len:160 (-) Transcript_3100:3154-3633(-)